MLLKTRPFRQATWYLLLLSWPGLAVAQPRAAVVIGETSPNPTRPMPGKLRSPFGVDFDARGNMYIVELEGGRVHRFSSAGQLTRIAGTGGRAYSGDGGPAKEAEFNGMHNVAATPDGDLYISDSWNHCVRKIDARSGVISTIAGTGEPGYAGDHGPATRAQFDFLMCVALNATNDKLYCADLRNRRIRVVDLKTRVVRTVAGNGQRGVPKNGAVAERSPLIDPRAVAVDSKENVYILERAGHALRMVSPDGRIRTVAGTGSKGEAVGPALQSQFGSPKHVSVDSDDNVYIADDQNARIVKYDPDQETVSVVLGNGAKHTELQLRHPHGVCVHADGSLYVVDTGHHRIVRLSP